MRVSILSLGKVKQEFIKLGEAEYLKRLSAWAKVGVEELPTEKFAGESEQLLKKKEADLFIKAIPKGSYLIVLDERGKGLSSEQLSKQLQNLMVQGESHFCFGIGGAYGWDDEVRKKARLTLSLSPMTFTYQMTRLILIEQLYRSFALINNVPHHKS